jgi:pyrroline-5-carboxylate reductase
VIKVGFIGYGSMGSMLVNSFISSGALTPGEIIVSTRTKSKLDLLKNQWGDIVIAGDNTEAARQAKYIFVCVKLRK